jgi:hypothetical protein
VRQSGIDYGQCIDDLQLTCDVYQAAEMLNCVAYVPLHRH